MSRRGVDSARDPAEIREAIISAAREVFSREGYSPPTLGEIAEHAGFEEGLLTRLFPSKATLFMEAVLVQSGDFFDDYSREMKGRSAPALTPVPDPPTRAAKTSPTPPADAVERRGTRRSSAEVKALILDAARTVFAERGYSNTTTREIAERAGVVEVLLFRHFQSKNNLFVEAVLTPFSQLFDHFLENLEQDGPQEDAFQTLKHWVATVYDMALPNRRLLTGLISASEFESEALGENLLGMMGSVIDRMGPITEGALSALDLRQADIDVLDRAALAMIMGMAIFDPWIMPDGPTRPTRERIVDEITTVLRYGLVPTEGKKPTKPARRTRST